MDIKILRKYIFIILVVFATVACLIEIYRISPLLGSDGVFMYSQEKIEKFQREQKNKLEYICEYISNIDNDIRWENINPDVLTCYYDSNGAIDLYEISIDDDMSRTIQDLDENGLVFILKENNYIQFVFWTSLDSSCGLIYCDEQPIMHYNDKINIVPLSDNNWYYYNHIAN